jgi:hypothetical protein
MVAVFAASALLQYNDPDPLGWTAIYGAAALAALGWPRLRPPWLLPVAVGLAATGWAAALAPQALPGLRPADLVKTMHAGTPSIELGRELLGLLIVAVWMAVLAATVSRPGATRRSTAARRSDAGRPDRP